MAERYEIVKTLIRGKQSTRKTETKSGVRVTAHKKPVGFAVYDKRTKDIAVMTYVEALEKITKYGSVNAQVTITERSNGKKIPYLRSKAGFENLQSETIVEDPVEYVKSTENIKISSDMESLIEKYESRGKKEEKPQYTKDEILEIIEEVKTTA